MQTSPDQSTLPPFYKPYVSHVAHWDMLTALRNSGDSAQALLATIPEEKGEYRYAAGKWSIKEVLCHMMDAERVFSYRALRFARADQTPLAGFEENDYAPRANAHARSMQQLLQEIRNLRKTTIDLFESFTPAMLAQKGTANNQVISVMNIGYVIAGHETHHCRILTERYLQ